MPCACTPEELLVIPNDICLGKPRLTTPSRWAFYNCNTAIPETDDFNTLTAAMLSLYEAGELSISPELTLFNFEDPTYDEVAISDCKAAIQIPATRAITFEDRNIINPQSVSPFTGNKYFDYQYWKYIDDNQANLLPILIYCNGDAKILNRQFTLRVILNYIRSGTQGGPSIETKQCRMAFIGDPINLGIVPTFSVDGWALP